jgi:hypothetical protein
MLCDIARQDNGPGRESRQLAEIRRLNRCMGWQDKLRSKITHTVKYMIYNVLFDNITDCDAGSVRRNLGCGVVNFELTMHPTHNDAEGEASKKIK